MGLMKHELGGKNPDKIAGLRAKAYSDLIDDGSKDKKAKGITKCDIKTKIKL